MKDRTPLWPVLCALLSLAPFVPLLIPDGRIVPSNDYCDYASYQLPVREFARQEWLAGRFPLWIPYLGCGMPLHAGQQAALCYPLLSPFVLAFGANYGIKFSLFSHLLLTYVGQYRLCRVLSVSRAGSAFAAAITTQSAFLIAHLMEGHVTMVLAAALVPWFFVALIELTRRPGPLTAAGISAVVALLVLTGHPQILYYAALFGTLWAAGSLVTGSAAVHRFRFVAWAGLAGVLAVLVGLVQLLPALELLQDGGAASERGSGDYAGTFALKPLDLLRFVAPNILGNPLQRITEFETYDFFHERVGYVGIATPLLALYALLRRAARPWEYGVSLLAGLTVVIALGHSTPLFGALGSLVPGLFLFRCPGRVFSVLSVFGPLLAARGLDALRERRAAAAGSRMAMVVGALWLLGNSLAYLVLRDSERFHWTAYTQSLRGNAVEAAAGAMLVLALALVLMIIPSRLASARPAACGALLILTLFDLWHHNAANFALAHEPQPEIPGPVLNDDPPARFVHVPDPPGYSWIGLRYSKMVPAAIRGRRVMIGTNEGGVVPAAVECLHRAVQRSGKAVLAVSTCRYECQGRDPRRWTPVPNVLPRIRFLPESHVELARPIEEIQPEQYPPCDLSFRISREDPHLLILDVQVPTVGMLVVADTFYPGWKSSVDGEPREITCVHGVFRGVPVEAGEHRVAFRYDPASFRWGLAGTAAGLAGLCLLLGIGWRQGKSARLPDSRSDNLERVRD